MNKPSIVAMRLIGAALMCLVYSVSVYANVAQGLTAYQERNYQQAFEVFKALAEQGEPDAQFYLGVMYTEGTGTKIDSKQAAYWLEKAARAGNVLAPFEYAPLLERGEGVRRNTVEAQRWYKRGVERLNEIRELAERGNGFSQIVLSYIYDNGKGVEKDLAEAVYWARLAAEQKHPQGIYHWAHHLEEGTNGLDKDPKMAAELFEEGANDGFAWSQASLAISYSYMSGDGVDLNHEKAMHWAGKAADQGSGMGAMIMGFLYLDGEGVEEDSEKAKEWFEKAAHTESLRGSAATELGRLYLDGEINDRNLSMAAEWFQVGYERGDQEAAKFLAEMYYTGMGVDKDISRSAELFQQGADGGSAFAQRRIGDLYREGEGVQRDISIARDWYEKAYEKGDEEALESLLSMRWDWRADINGDGKTTVSDVGGWIKWIFFAPGDFAVGGLLEVAPSFAEFFELTHNSYGNWLSLIISIFTWLVFFLGLSLAD